MEAPFSSVPVDPWHWTCRQGEGIIGHRMKAYIERLRQHLQRKSQQNATLKSTVSRHFRLRSNQDPQHAIGRTAVRPVLAARLNEEE
jgi:hypothetical protein